MLSEKQKTENNKQKTENNKNNYPLFIYVLISLFKVFSQNERRGYKKLKLKYLIYQVQLKKLKY